jgi:hypothetical protein
VSQHADGVLAHAYRLTLAQHADGVLAHAYRLTLARAYVLNPIGRDFGTGSTRFEPTEPGRVRNRYWKYVFRARWLVVKRNVGVGAFLVCGDDGRQRDASGRRLRSLHCGSG